MGSETRGGRGKVMGTRRRAMEKGIEDALSEAMTPKDERSNRQKIEDYISNKARKYQDTMSEFRLTGEIDRYGEGGRAGDVRDNSNRGKTY